MKIFKINKNIREVLIRVIATFLGCIGLLQMDMMFWTYYWTSPEHGFNWVDIWWGNTPILLISDYNCWIIFQLCVWAVLILMWIEYFTRNKEMIKSVLKPLFKKVSKRLKDESNKIFKKLYHK